MKLADIVISKAKTWGFICQYIESNSWLILPQNPDQRWKLQQVKKQWILSVGDIPQLRLNSEGRRGAINITNTSYYKINSWCFIHMNFIETLPDIFISSQGVVYQACHWIKNLPYGFNSDSNNSLIIFE